MTLTNVRSVLKARLGNGHVGDPAREELKTLLWEAEEVHFDPGAVLFIKGDMPNVRPGLFLLVTGTVEVLPSGAGPADQLPHTDLLVRLPGAFLGQGGARLDQPRIATVRSGPSGAGLLWWQNVELIKTDAPILWKQLANEAWRIGLEGAPLASSTT